MSLLNMNGNVPCVVDVETTGTLAGYHEIIQIACLPLDQHFEPSSKYRFHYLTTFPDYPDRMEEEAARKHGLTLEKLEGQPTQSKGIEIFDEWFRNLNLPFGKKLIPIAHNWSFERGMLIHHQGMDSFNEMWHWHARDTFTLAAFINDLYVWHGRKHPFNAIGLGPLCRRFDIQLDNAHDALADCLATAKLYGELLRLLGG